MKMSPRSGQLVGWKTTQWKEKLVGLERQGFVYNAQAVTPIKQFSLLPVPFLHLSMAHTQSSSCSLPSVVLL